ncbi:MAG TPA: DUF5916 domain-containing protein [Vicinamibacterales bacterium]|nr:DUF5916 domain-containing protein [Vicinamibacterales bacterium]
MVWRVAAAWVGMGGFVSAMAGGPKLISDPEVAGRSVIAVRVDTVPRLDGTLRDPLWDRGIPITDFRQREPREGQMATERTSVVVLYDRSHLYFGIHCFDEEPAGIVATELRRDTDASIDDSFAILISPNHDGRSAYTFTVNPLGTQFDALVADEGTLNDSAWDGVWESNAVRTDDGWTATIAVPFATLNFKTSAQPVLGVNFRRFIRRKNEEDLWRAFLRIYGLTRVSQGGDLQGLEQIGSGRLFALKPFAVTGADAIAGGSTEALHSAGLDVKYGLRSSLVLNGTVNTDFADADVDPLRFNITPFRVLLPEKRPFFLENSGVFQFGAPNMQLFFSRQIGIDPGSGEQVPLDGGVKLTGTVGDYDVGILDARTRDSGSNPWANYAVGRVKRRLFAESYVGAIVTDKRSGSDSDPLNRSIGVDGQFRFAKAWTAQGYYAKTTPPVGTGGSGKNWAGSAGLAYDGDLVQGAASRTVVQPNFNPEVGFVDRTDLVTDHVGVEVKPHLPRGPVRQIFFIADYVGQPDTRGVLQTQQWQGTTIALFHSGALTNDDLVVNTVQRLQAPFNIFGNVVIPAGEYRFTRHQLDYESDPGRRIAYTVSEQWGGFYNGTLSTASATFNVRPVPRISLAGAETWNRFQFSGRDYDVYVGSLKTSYSMTRFLTASLLVQHNSADAERVSWNARLRYQYHPDSDLFVVFNDGPQFNSLSGGNPVLTRDRRLSVKWTYSFLR